MFINSIVPMEFGGTNTNSQTTTSGVELPFASLLTQAMDETKRLQEVTENDTQDLMLGNLDNIAQMQVNSMKAEAMLQTTVQLTTRVVNAYKEVMQMQV